ncbi:MAG: dimethylsulfoniopropionate demethylase [Silicimonas sp.]|nr:dimethylsulfoniopropionate demethylase [Silicimonas sp.]
MTHLARPIRIRRTPFTDAVDAAGVSIYSVYNRMLLPAAFDGFEEDYHHLKRHVQLWDVSCERQIEIAGPDAARLADMITPRDLSKMVEGQCSYLPVVDETGGMLNDPVIVKHGDDRYWISLADSDLLLWVKGIATALKMDVRVWEPDVSPLAIQGPKSDDLAARVFGEAIRDLRFFRAARFPFQGHQVLIARSGYSKQGGFEIYVEGTENGMPIWDALMAAGADLEVRAGGPNGPERTEAGLLSYGADMTDANTPYECGLVKFCKLDKPGDFIGKSALIKAQEDGPQRQIRAVAIEGRQPFCDRPWAARVGGHFAGQITTAYWSPDYDCTVAIAMMEKAHWTGGTEVEIETREGPARGLVRDAFWA